MDAQGITVDTVNKRIVVAWADRAGDVVPAPADAIAQFTSSDLGVLRLAPEPSSPWVNRILPVGPGTATVSIAVLDGTGNPWRNADGDVVTLDPVHISIGPGLPEAASVSVSDEPPANAPAASSATPAPIAAAVDPAAPGATSALAVDQAVQNATGGAGATSLAVSGVTFGDGSLGAAYTNPAISGASVTGGTPPYAFSAEGLPAGLVMAADGSISGTPGAVGQNEVTVTVTDAAGNTATEKVMLTVGDAPAGTPGAPAPTPSAAQTGGSVAPPGNPAGDEPSPAGGVTGTAGAAGGGSGSTTTDGQTAAGGAGGSGGTDGATEAGSGAQTAADTGQTADTTTAAESAAGGTPTVATDATGKPLYTYAGTGTPDPAAWIEDPAATTTDGKTLYTFTGDTAGQPPTGSSADWVPYTGATQPAGTTGATGTGAGGSATGQA